ncbi:MAG: glycosyltransferase WbuB [Candidatus Portnoybacteria bacterium CG23_combo_of_CG06-09_8_20_14_all_37_13]|uniref:Glycosyltransferase WbuB n=1 Tax=Candidatus Portnoybacteria bacterium CG23_combo_of_CG06-09_8_20_14_all_37_13 TaxID=1974819 RepID=A0A2G9YCA1_9BACT|nr:MAG: glycosyltransferase WbuB [Candidatus Portnoybacteria bacterium CG23_combo_of_CG06-09_8_20_14_all_37_13]
MRILVIHQYFLEKGGFGGSRFNQFAKYWAGKGHQITVVAGTVDYATGQKSRKYPQKIINKNSIDKNITVLRCHVSGSYNKNFLGRSWAYLSFTLSSLWAGLFCAGKQDIIVATSPPLLVGLTGYILSKIKHISWIFEVRDLWPKFAIDAGVLKNSLLIKFSYWLESFIYKKAKLINVLTPAFKDYLLKEKKVPDNKIIYIPNAADLDLMQPGEKNNWVRKKYNWQDRFVVLYIGAHGVANDLWQIINAAQELKNKQDISFVLIGDGMEKNRLIKKAELENSDNIQFIDPVPKEKVADFINASDVCTAVLRPVFTTTYPNKVFDYMACAKPIILPIDGACRELVVEQAKAGIFVEPGNAQEFKKAVLFFYQCPEKLEKLGINGYNFVRENFDRQKLADKYLKILYENLFSR